MRRAFLLQQLLFDKPGAGTKNTRRAGQWHDFQAAANFAQGCGNALQMLAIPLGRNVFDDGVFGVLQAIARFPQHRFFGAGQGDIAFISVFRVLAAGLGQAFQCVFDGNDLAGNSEQLFIVQLAVGVNHQLQCRALFKDAFAQIAQAQYGQGIGNPLNNWQCLVERRLGIATGEANVQAVFDQVQLFFQGANHRAHGVGVRYGKHILAFIAGFLTFQQRFFQMVGFVDALQMGIGWKAGGVFTRAGDVIKQVFDQFVIGKAVQCFNAMNSEHFDFFIQLAQQILNRNADFNCIDFNRFHQRHANIPERKARGAMG